MQFIGPLLIMGFCTLTIVTFFSTHVKGRRSFINILYLVCFLYSIAIGAFFLRNTPTQVIGSLPLAAAYMALYMLGLLILEYKGWTRITKSKPMLHLLYLAAVSGFPLFTYLFSIQRNEAIAAFSSTICFLCLIRYCEKKRQFFTFLFLALGIGGTLMTKPTSAIICILMFIIIVIATIIKERNPKTALPREFFLTIPFYIGSAIVAPHNEMVHTVQLINPEITRHMAITILAFEILWCMPIFFIFPRIRKFANDLSLVIVAGWMALCLTFIYQMAHGVPFTLITLHFGLFITYHYVPFIGVFALGAVYVSEGLATDNGFDPDTEITTIAEGDIKNYSKRLIYNHLIYFLVIAFAFVLFFGNFPFFMLSFR